MPTANPIRILHVVSPGRVGGLERVVQALAIGHRGRGHEVSVGVLVGSDHDGSAFTAPLEDVGVTVHRCQVELHTVLRERRFVRELCLLEGPQVVHTHGYRPDILDAPVARRLGIPTLSTEHGMSRMGGRTAIYEWLQMRGFRRLDAVVAVSRPIAAMLEESGVEAARIHVVPNAWAEGGELLERIAARRRLALPEDALVVGFVGRLIHAKGGDVLLRAIQALADERLQVAVIGEGPERPDLEQRVRDAGLADRVRFHGEVLDAAACFRAFDLFVSSSRTEGTPIVLFEAIAAGVPVVATSVGGVPDVLGPDQALLVPPEDPSALAAAIREALAEPGAASVRAENAMRRLGEHYALEPWLDRYESIYRALIRPSPR